MWSKEKRDEWEKNGSKGKKAMRTKIKVVTKITL